MVRSSVLAGGFSLMELMLVVLLIGLLATIAWPAWRSYQVDATSAVLTANVQSMALFQEDYRIRYGSYATNFTDQQQIAEVIGWQLAKMTAVPTPLIRARATTTLYGLWPTKV